MYGHADGPRRDHPARRRDGGPLAEVANGRVDDVAELQQKPSNMTCQGGRAHRVVVADHPRWRSRRPTVAARLHECALEHRVDLCCAGSRTPARRAPAAARPSTPPPPPAPRGRRAPCRGGRLRAMRFLLDGRGAPGPHARVRWSQVDPSRSGPTPRGRTAGRVIAREAVRPARHASTRRPLAVLLAMWVQ